MNLNEIERDIRMNKTALRDYENQYFKLCEEIGGENLCKYNELQLLIFKLIKELEQLKRARDFFKKNKRQNKNEI